jgi:V/A-type H+-transporting ATPase subunit D
MILNVSATRMELLRLRKRLKIAKRGHKLLKDKQDELVRQLSDLVKNVKELRLRVERRTTEALRRFVFAKASMEPEALSTLFAASTVKSEVHVDVVNLMSVRVPKFSLRIEGEVNYSFITTGGDVDDALNSVREVMNDLVELAEKEKSLELLAEEIEKTRRRVNALEYILIPNLEDTIRYIRMKLAEMERSDLSRLMKIKDIIRSH